MNQYIWEYKGLLPVRVNYMGQMRTNWGIQDGLIRDASGNLGHFSFSKVITNDWMVYRILPLDPTKAWRFQVNVARNSDFPATNLFSFTIPWPLTGAIQTNFGGFQVQIGYVNADMLNVELVSKPPETRLTFVKAVDDTGNSLDNWTGSWGQHSFWKSLKLSNPIQVHATVAVHPNYPIGFTFLPRYERAVERPKPSRMQPAGTTR
jgi:hypothetical protein